MKLLVNTIGARPPSGRVASLLAASEDTDALVAALDGFDWNEDDEEVRHRSCRQQYHVLTPPFLL